MKTSYHMRHTQNGWMVVADPAKPSNNVVKRAREIFWNVVFFILCVAGCLFVAVLMGLSGGG